MTFFPEAGRMLDAAMIAGDLSSQALADDLGVKANMVNMMRAGTAAIPADRFLEIAARTGVEPRAFLFAAVRSFPNHRSWRAVAIALAVVGPVDAATARP